MCRVDGVEGEIADRIIELEDAMARNPVKPLVDAGLYQTIVEDVDTSQDEYGYRARFANWADQKTTMLPSTVKKRCPLHGYGSRYTAVSGNAQSYAPE